MGRRRQRQNNLLYSETSFVPKVIFIVKILSKVSINKRIGIEENGSLWNLRKKKARREGADAT